MEISLSEEEVKNLNIKSDQEIIISDSIIQACHDLQAVLDATKKLSGQSAVTKKRIQEEADIDGTEYLSALLRVLQSNQLVRSTGRGGGWQAVYNPTNERIDAVAKVLSKIGYDGVTKFDQMEPEYQTFQILYDETDAESYLALLGICAGTVDYQLAGDAQRFWNELEQTALSHGKLNSTDDIKEILEEFMKTDVNARLNQQKRARLNKLSDNSFDDWFIENHGEAEPLTVWENLADALDNKMKAKTVVFAMKVYDIIHFIENNTYLDFPQDIPIPCDLQVERVAYTSGITDSESDDEVMSAWAKVASQASDELGRAISLLRIDSIVWQSGQIIGEHEPSQEAARDALIEHFEEVGIGNEEAENLAEVLTAEM